MEIAGFCNEMIMSVKSWGWNVRLGRYGPGLRFNVWYLLAGAWSIGSKPHYCCHVHGQFGGGINQAGLIVSPAGDKGDILTVVGTNYHCLTQGVIVITTQKWLAFYPRKETF